MRFGSETTSLHLFTGLAGAKTRARTSLCQLQRKIQDLRREMRSAKRAAGTTGWWSDLADSWAEEEFREGRRGF
jgi:hypothetical protein